MRYIVDHPQSYLEGVSLRQRESTGAPRSETPTPVAIKANDEYTESLKRRLRLLDLKIEREEVLNQLAAL